MRYLPYGSDTCGRTVTFIVISGWTY